MSERALEIGCFWSTTLMAHTTAMNPKRKKNKGGWSSEEPSGASTPIAEIDESALETREVEEIRPLADGRVYTGEKAKELGLIDSIGNFRDAVDRAMTLAGVTGEPELVYPEKKDKFWMEFLKEGANAAGHEVAQGATEGVVGTSAMQSGILLLAPGLSR